MEEVGYARFVRSGVGAGIGSELHRVDALAVRLRTHLGACSDAIDAAHVHGAQSGAIQTIVSELLHDHLRFDEEVVLKSQEGLVTHARPDFIYRLSEGRGILAEVERRGGAPRYDEQQP